MIREFLEVLKEANFRDRLEETFVPNPFTLIKEKTGPGERRYYVEYDESTSQSIIDQMRIMMNEETDATLLDMKNGALDKLNSAVEKALAGKPLNYTSEQYQQASDWLNNQSSSCPVFIVFKASLEGLTTEETATQIINQLQTYNQTKTSAETIRDNCLLNIMTNTDVFQVRERIRSDIDAIKNL